MKFLLFINLIFLLFCSNNPVNKVNEFKNLKVQNIFVSEITTSSAVVAWTCSDEADGVLLYGKELTEERIFLPVKSKFHRYRLENLSHNTNYKYLALCSKNLATALNYNYFLNFKTLRIPDPLPIPPPPFDFTPVFNRGIWIVGGLNSNNEFVSQIDVYDPVEEKWYEKITTMPTPRSHAGVVAFGNKIYIMSLLQN